MSVVNGMQELYIQWVLDYNITMSLILLIIYLPYWLSSSLRIDYFENIEIEFIWIFFLRYPEFPVKLSIGTQMLYGILNNPLFNYQLFIRNIVSYVVQN